LRSLSGGRTVDEDLLPRSQLARSSDGLQRKLRRVWNCSDLLERHRRRFELQMPRGLRNPMESRSIQGVRNRPHSQSLTADAITFTRTSFSDGTGRATSTSS
jgi:hypothetical protein